MAQVKIYTTPTCPWCKKAKDFMKKKKISFKEIDVSSDQDAQKEMIDLSGQNGVPVLDIKGTVLVGFDEEAIQKALKK
jgi:glutaredoxin 3